MRPINRALRCGLLVCGLGVALATPARADLVPISNPTVVFNGPGTEVVPALAFDSVNKIYLVAWGTTQIGPCLGRFLDATGQPLGNVFTLSDGATQCGWVRATAGGGKFLVTFNKLSGGTAKAPILFQLGRVISYTPNGPQFATGEVFIDNIGDIEADSGTTYVPSTNSFMVTWWKNRFMPQSYVRRFNMDGTVGDIQQLTDNSDGLSDPEIACDPVSNHCLTVGFSWDTAHNTQGATWARLIDAGSAAPIGGMMILDSANRQESQTVTFSAATNQFVVAWVRTYNRVVGKTVAPDGTQGAGLYSIKTGNGNQASCAYGYGQVNASLQYNHGSGTSAIGIVDWCGVAFIQELDGGGQPIASQFFPVSGLATLDNQPAIAANEQDAQFLFLHNYKYVSPYSRAYQANLSSGGGGGGGGTPPPPTLIDLSPAGAPNGSWFLAEGAANPGANGFKTYYLIQNTNPVDVTVRAYFSGENGIATVKQFTVPKQSRTTVNLQDQVGAGSFGSVFQSLTPNADIDVERSIYWGPNFEGSTDATATKYASQTWYFAEGSRGGELFNNYFLLFNPTQVIATVTGSYYRVDGQVVTRSYQIGPQQRLTIDADAINRDANTPVGLEGIDFSTSFSSSVPIVAERAMYWGWVPNQGWIGGHGTMGSQGLNNYWAFAEGNAAANFETYYLLLNPNPTPITIDATFLTEFSGTIHASYPLPGNTRFTVPVNSFFGNVGPMGATFSSTDGNFLAERSIYWGNRVEGTNTIGTPYSAGEWHLPEGATGGVFDTFMMLMNPTDAPVTVDVTLYVEGIGQITLPDTMRPTLAPLSRKTMNMKDVLHQLEPLVGIPLVGHSFSTRVKVFGAGSIVAEHAIYWNFVDTQTYWRSGAASMGIPH
jgi:hypothetical protein